MVFNFPHVAHRTIQMWAASGKSNRLATQYTAHFFRSFELEKKNYQCITPCTGGKQGRRRRGGGGPDPRTFENRAVRPPRFENEVAKIRCFFRFLGYFGVGWPPCRRFDPPTQKSVTTPLRGRLVFVYPPLLESGGGGGRTHH